VHAPIRAHTESSR